MRVAPSQLSVRLLLSSTATPRDGPHREGCLLSSVLYCPRLPSFLEYKAPSLKRCYASFESPSSESASGVVYRCGLDILGLYFS
ncbi:hypothetical protein BJX66DRAFT_303025 [Aspergillus keveii]|uniref:Secreted protein n=1 Tax=Aspergillus keveii TaxID=714993 RepID=A0ABR4G890_9EURO